MEFWQSHSLTTCRCPDKQIYYGSECSKENCIYVVNPDEVKNIYADVATREVSEEIVQEFKNEINHQETTDLNKIGDCTVKSVYKVIYL